MTLVDAYETRVADAILAVRDQGDKPGFVVKTDKILATLRAAHDLGFEHLACLTAIDFPPDTPVEIKIGPDAAKVPKEDPRIEVVYNLYSYIDHQHLVLRVALPREAPEVDSATSIWKGADWLEREVLDLYGVSFRGHPNPKRLFMPEGWKGHPLRKDYAEPEQFINTADGVDVVSYDPKSGW